MSGDALGAHDEDQFHDREDHDDDEGVEEPVSAKQRCPYGQVVAAEGQGHRESGEGTAAKDLARRLVAVSPRVDRERPRRQAEDADPRQWDWREQRADTAGEY